MAKLSQAQVTVIRVMEPKEKYNSGNLNCQPQTLESLYRKGFLVKHIPPSGLELSPKNFLYELNSKGFAEKQKYPVPLLNVIQEALDG